MASPGKTRSILDRIIFRNVTPTDVPRCFEIESSSYPDDEAASKSSLQYRQHHAAQYFRCAFLINDGRASSDGCVTKTSIGEVSYQGQDRRISSTVRGRIVGFVCSTRCDSFTAESMTTHVATGRYLAVHSVVVDEKYRGLGVASTMLQDYVRQMTRLNDMGTHGPIDAMVLLAKRELLGFYLDNGFRATRPSPIVHGRERWYEMEREFDAPRASGGYDCYLVDSFADPARQGSGNPAGVVVLEAAPGSDEDGMEPSSGVSSRGRQWMATVAREINQAETAFVWPAREPSTAADDGGDVDGGPSPPRYEIRFYTCTGVEVDLCGHATLAAASTLLGPGGHRVVAFGANNGELLRAALGARANGRGAPGDGTGGALRISLSFPWKDVTALERDEFDLVTGSVLPRAFAGASSGNNSWFKIKQTDFFVRHALMIGTTDTREDLFVELSEEGFDLLGEVKVDYDALCEFGGYTRGVIICCRATKDREDAESGEEDKDATSQRIDFRSRFFGPKVGILEDAVTGSAHCSLGPHFGAKLNSDRVVGRQESERGGLVECKLLHGDDKARRVVEITGTAVRAIAGMLFVKISHCPDMIAS